MKKLLFVINSLSIGGSEKSLVSLLNLIDYSKYEVDLLMLKVGEELDKFIPKEVNILEVPEYYRYLQGTIKDLSIINKLKYSIIRTKCSMDIRMNGKARNNRVRNNQQIFYRNQKQVIKTIDKKYDVGVAYAQGFPTYFLAEKVIANKKISWINCDYSATMYDKNEDKYYYDKIDKIVAVSEYGKESIIRVNKEYENKIQIIKDIINPKLIIEMANEKITDMSESDFNIVTVARLVKGYKGYDIAIKAAKLLKENGYKFRWYAVGDGHDKEIIKKLISQYDLQDNFILLGSKDNPYPYMKECDLYVQPSRVEGFGLSVVEAKILKKIIICTNFDTAKYIINNEVDGIIVNIDAVSLYEGIAKIIENKNLREQIEKNVKNQSTYSSLDEIDKFYNIIQ